MVMEPCPLAEWMREQLRERDWIEADLARAIGIHSGMVSRWMAGTIPAPHNCRRIAMVLGVDPAFVLRLVSGVSEAMSDPVKDELKAMIDGTDLEADDRAGTLRILLRSWADKDRSTAHR
ncbi:MAG: helix-turn-helix transcriptional regulator [Thermomicrobiales bacterium]